MDAPDRPDPHAIADAQTELSGLRQHPVHGRSPAAAEAASADTLAAASSSDSGVSGTPPAAAAGAGEQARVHSLGAAPAPPLSAHCEDRASASVESGPGSTRAAAGCAREAAAPPAQQRVRQSPRRRELRQLQPFAWDKCAMNEALPLLQSLLPVGCICHNKLAMSFRRRDLHQPDLDKLACGGASGVRVRRLPQRFSYQASQPASPGIAPDGGLCKGQHLLCVIMLPEIGNLTPCADPNERP